MKTGQVYSNATISKPLKQELIPRDQGAIKFYLRRPNKQTIIVYEGSQFKGKQLLNLVQTKMKIRSSDLVLFLKGEKISNSEKCLQKVYDLKQNDIVHVHDFRNSSKGQITIMLKSFQCPIKMEELFCISVKIEQKIGKALQNHLQFTQQMAFVQSGRVLDKEKSFLDESVYDQTQIVITTFSREKNERKQKTQNQQKLQTQIFVQKEASVGSRNRSNEFEDIQKSNITKPTLRKSVTWSIESCNLNLHELNFKKKQKPSIYKSMKILDGKEIVWQSDGSGDLNKNLLQKMPIRKHKHQDSAGKQVNKIVQVKEVKHEQDHVMYSSDDSYDEYNESKNMFTSSQRKQLKNQLNKLLFSEASETKQLVTKLQPPQMLDDDFLEQAEQIQIVPDDEDNYLRDDEDDEQDGDDDQPELNQKPKPSMDLRQSIGKSRGQFVLPMIPTRDFDLKEDSDDSDQE